MSLAFSCDYHGTNLCFNNGICVNSTQCLCDPRYERDYTFGRFDNCVVPKGYLLGYFIVHTIFSFISIASLMFFANRAKHQVRKLGFAFALFSFNMWLVVLSVFVQNGNYTAGLLALMLTIVGFIVLVVIPLLNLILKPLFAMKIRWGFERFLQAEVFIGAFICFLCLTAISAGLAFTWMDEDAVRFNFILGVLLFEISIIVIVIVGLMLFVAHKMEIMLIEMSSITVNHNGIATMNEARQRLAYLRRVLYAVFVLLGITLLPLPIIWFVYGSVPYMFVFWSSAIMSANLIAPSVCMFLRGKSKTSIGPSHSRDNAAIVAKIEEDINPLTQIQAKSQTSTFNESGGNRASRDVQLCS